MNEQYDDFHQTPARPSKPEHGVHLAARQRIA